MRMELTVEIIHALGTDAGNRSARSRNLQTWDKIAQDACYAESDRLYVVYDEWNKGRNFGKYSN